MCQRAHSTRVPWEQLVAAQGVLLLVVPRESNFHARGDVVNKKRVARCTWLPHVSTVWPTSKANQ